jgi:phage tail tape-measure protein
MVVWRASPLRNEELNGCPTGAAAGIGAGGGEVTAAVVSEAAAGTATGAGSTGFDVFVLVEGALVSLGWRWG